MASAERGLGPARQSEPLPLDRVVGLGLGWPPLVAGGPADAARLIASGALVCVRELELAFAVRGDVSIDTTLRTASWRLPRSKTDPKAPGLSRTWVCVCV